MCAPCSLTIKHLIRVSILLALTTACLPAGQIGAQTTDIKSATAEELVAAVRELESAGGMDASTRETVAKRAVELLTAVDLSGTAKEATWSRLVDFAKPALEEMTSEQKKQLAASLSSSSLDLAAADRGALESRIVLMEAAGAPKSSIRDAVETWLRSNGLDGLSISSARWCLQQCLPQNTKRNAFSVVWSGHVSPPVGGEYKFSVSAINVNKQLGMEFVRHSMKVFVDGQQVLGATPEEWKWQGEPIQLAAGTPVLLRVEMDYSTSHSTYGDSPHALLYWEGPGISRQIVPSSVLAPTDGEGEGLHAEYRWTESGQEQDVEQQNRNIEYAWATCRDVAPHDPELVRRLTERIWQIATDSSDGEPPTRLTRDAQIYFRDYMCTQFLSCARRRELLGLLQQTPEVLGRPDETQILRLYGPLRFGDEEAALDLLGTWMQARADVEPSLALDYFDANHRFYRTVALYLRFRGSGPELYQQFQDWFLEMPDGRCCLPVAYTTAYAHLFSGNIAGWIDALDARLQDESLKGDLRVNWLIARAMAEEIRRLPDERRYVGQPLVAAGLGWLDEAMLVAESPEANRRAVKERVVRLAAIRDWDAAEGELEGHAELDDWGDRIAELKQQAADALARQEDEADAAYLAEIKRRKANAAKRGDAVAEARYTSMIEARENASE